MRTRRPAITAIILIVGLCAGMGCKRSAEARAQDASSMIRNMNKDILDAQKKVISKFKALPEADAIQINYGKDLDGWAVSERNLSVSEDVMEKTLIGYQKESKDEALIGELRLYVKKVSKATQEKIHDLEIRESRAKKELNDGKIVTEKMSLDLNEEDKKACRNMLMIIPLEIEYRKELQRISSEYELKLAKLLND